MRFTNSFLDELRERVPISSVIGQRVSWDRRKTNATKGDYWACCPFHGEKTPSFHCEDQKGRYYCFGCGVSGNHFRFLTELDGMGFVEAVERVASLAGIPLPQPDPQAEKREQQRTTLFEVMEMAADYFTLNLQTTDGANARAYLRQRGLDAKTIADFRLGFAPNSRNGLKSHLASKGVNKEQIEAVGLVVSGPDIAVSYDRFRDRIMFPILDTRERVIAFGGRAMSSDVPAKYLNSPETELFHKGRTLYNFAKARQASRDSGTMIVVEGYMDVIALARAGIDNAVAPLGTALTDEQLELLWKVADEPLLSFDGDAAGQKAAFRVVDLALPKLKPGKSLRFVPLPEGKDPDDVVTASGADAFRSLLKESARPLADMIWARHTDGMVFDTPERRAALEKELNILAHQIGDEGVRRHYAQNFRDRVRQFFGTQTRRAQVAGQGRPNAAQSVGRQAVSPRLAGSALVGGTQAALPLREAAIFAMAAHHPYLVEEDFERFEQIEPGHADLATLRSFILDCFAHAHQDGNAQAPLSFQDMNNKLEGHAAKHSLERCVGVCRRARLWVIDPQAAPEDVREAFRQAVDLHLRVRQLQSQRTETEHALAEAIETEDETAVSVLSQTMGELQTELTRLESHEALIDGFGTLSQI